MALTSVVIDPQANTPKDLAYLPAFAAGAAQGFKFTMKADSNGNISGGPKVVEVVADGTWYWSFQDSQTPANGTMVPVLPYERLPIQIPNGGTITIFVNVASGTPNIWVVQRY